ncbi:MAG: helix-turn-helix domain-containing protein [Candidatus Woesearchaeota archaeon]
MADESFMLLSLKEGQSKRLAQVIGNETCRRILDYLADRDYTTESTAAKDLGLPLSTVHYNLKSLRESGLVVADEFHYSDKGKEVPHYRLAKKYIIIAPREEQGFLDRLKKLWPLAAIAVGVAAVMELVQRFLLDSGEKVASTADAGVRMLAESAPAAAEEASRFPSPVTAWFLVGALFAIVAFALKDLVRKR